VAPTPDNVLGILSLVFWALIVVVSLKYVTFVLRADNRGEGGIMRWSRWCTGPRGICRRCAAAADPGLCGAALFYGTG